MVGMALPGKRSRKLALMVEAFKGPARGNVTEAARVAGYSFPEKVGHRVYKRYRELFDQAEDELRQSLKVGGEELDERISELARNPKHKDHYKALELLCRLHGKLSDKVHVTLDRATLNTQLDELLTLMLSSRAPIHNVVVLPAEGALLTKQQQITEQASTTVGPAS